MFPKAKTKSFETIKDRSPEYYCRPKKKNHESVDAFRFTVQSAGEYVELFQMTVSKRHPIKVGISYM